VTRLHGDDLAGQFQPGEEVILFSQMSQIPLELTQPPTQWIMAVLSPGATADTA